MKKNRVNILLPAIIVLIALLLLGASVLLRPKTAEDMVIISVAGKEYKRIPLTQPQEVVIRQDNGEVNTVVITENGAYMRDSTCKNQRCVNMGEVTLDNWEIRTNQEFIICLPNQIVVELSVAQQGQK